MDILLYPYHLLVFWFTQLPMLLISKFSQVNNYTLNLFSIPILLKTFFHPLKNEYREGLVLFSRIAGVIVKSFLLLIGLSVMLLLLFIEGVVITLTVTLPIWWFYFLFLR